MIPDWVREIVENWIKEGRYGYLQLNTQAGTIINVNKHETIKAPPSAKTGGSSGSSLNPERRGYGGK